MKWLSPHQRVIAAWVHAWPGQSIRELAEHCNVDPYHSDFHKRLMRMESAGWLTMHRRWDVFGAPCDIQPTALLTGWFESMWVDESQPCSSSTRADSVGENRADPAAVGTGKRGPTTLVRSAA